MFGALEDGASVFLAPIGNCGDVAGHIPDGLQVYPVATLDDAVDVLRTLDAGGTPARCPNS
jgi:PDZ domain-containing protein